jgi:hypothetical protein
MSTNLVTAPAFRALETPVDAGGEELRQRHDYLARFPVAAHVDIDRSAGWRALFEAPEVNYHRTLFPTMSGHKPQQGASP